MLRRFWGLPFLGSDMSMILVMPIMINVSNPFANHISSTRQFENKYHCFALSIFHHAILCYSCVLWTPTNRLRVRASRTDREGSSVN